MTPGSYPTRGVPADLSDEQVEWVISRVSGWLRCRAEHQRTDWMIGGSAFHGLTPRELQARRLRQIAADADHSVLLRRMLHGHDPLPQPPPKRSIYPEENP